MNLEILETKTLISEYSLEVREFLSYYNGYYKVLNNEGIKEFLNYIYERRISLEYFESIAFS